jgi:hypothetical protein
LPATALIKAEVVDSQTKDKSLKNVVGDANDLFYVGKKTLQDHCPENCYVQVSLLKLGSTDVTKLQAIALTKSTEVTVNLSDQLPVSFPYSKEHDFTLIYIPRDESLKAALDRGVEVHIQNRFVPILTTAVLTGDRKDQSTEKSKSYVTGDIWSNIIHVPAADIALFDNPTINIELQTTDKGTVEVNENDIRNSKMYWTSVQVGSSTKSLNDKKYIEDFVTLGEFKYYRVKKPKNADGLIILTVLDGEADLYAKRGHTLYPDINTYDFASTSIKDDEINLPKSSNSAENEDFTIGVLGAASSSRYRISFFINSGIKVYPVQAGEFIHKFVEKGESLVLQYDMPYNDNRVTIGFTSEHSIVEAYANFYDENTAGFIDSLPEADKKGVISLGTSLYPNVITRVKAERQTGSSANQLLVRIKNPEAGQMVSLYIVPFSSELPVQVKAREKITDSISKDQTQIYQFTWDNKVQEAELEIEAAHGKFKVILTDNQSFKEDPNPLVIDIEASQHFARRVVDLKKIGANNPDLGLFKRYLAKIVPQTDSQFSLLSTVKGDSFVNVKAGNHHVMRFDPHQPTSFYYRVGKDVKSLALQFELKSPVYIAEGFGTTNSQGDSMDDALFQKLKNITSCVDVYYVREEDFDSPNNIEKKRIHAKILKNSTVEDRDRYYLNLEVATMKGYLIVSPKKNNKGAYVADKSFIASFKLSVNGIVAISPNYRTSGTVAKGQTAVYSVLLPSTAIFEFTVSICRGPKVEVSIVDASALKKEAIMEPRYITADFEDSDHTSTIDYRYSNLGAKRTVLIQIKHLGSSDNEATFAVKTTQFELDDTVTLDKFFDRRVNFFGHKILVSGLSAEQTPDTVLFHMDRVYPLDGFLERFQDDNLRLHDYLLERESEGVRPQQHLRGRLVPRQTKLHLDGLFRESQGRH